MSLLISVHKRKVAKVDAAKAAKVVAVAVAEATTMAHTGRRTTKVVKAPSTKEARKAARTSRDVVVVAAAEEEDAAAMEGFKATVTDVAFGAIAPSTAESILVKMQM